MLAEIYFWLLEMPSWPDGSYGVIMSVFGCPQSYPGVWLEGRMTSKDLNQRGLAATGEHKINYLLLIYL